MKTKSTFFLSIIISILSFGQTAKKITIQESSITDKLNNQIQLAIENHDLIDLVNSKEIVTNQEFGRLYNIIAFEEGFNDNIHSPVALLHEEVVNKYPNNIVMIRIAKNIQLPQRSELEKMKRQLELGRLKAETAIDLLEWLPKENKEILAIGFEIPLIQLTNEMTIIAPDEYSFTESDYNFSAPTLSKNIIKFNTSKGENTYRVDVSKRGKKIKTTIGEIYSIETSEILKSNAQERDITFSRMPCNTIIYDTIETILPPDSPPCSGGCSDPNRPNTMIGRTLTIPSNDGVLDRFLIITDGIDYAVDGVGNDVDKILQKLHGIETFRSFLDFGIDIMIVDWPSQAGWVQNNSAHLQNIITQLNQLPDFISIETLIGVSMGGPISRHALIEMETNGQVHNVNNWVAGDSPLQGSNLAIGIQAFVREMYITFPGKARVRNLNDLLNSPYPRQGLRYHLADGLDGYTSATVLPPIWTPGDGWLTVVIDGYIDPQPAPEYLEMQGWFDTNGYPTLTNRNMTIVDGADANTPIPGSNTRTLVKVNEEFKVWAYADGDAFSKVLKKQIIVQPDPWLPPTILLPPTYTKITRSIDHIDTAPGSMFPVEQFAMSDPTTEWFVPSFSHAVSVSALGIDTEEMYDFDISDSPFFDANAQNPRRNICITDSNNVHSDFEGQYGIDKINWIRNSMDPALFGPTNQQCCPHVIPQQVNFHFENQWGVAKSDFCMGDDVYIDGSGTTNDAESFQLTLYNVLNNQEITMVELDGSPDFVNITEAFTNSLPGLTFFPIEYRVKLRVYSTICGDWVDTSHNFTYRECCTPNPLYPPNGPTNIWTQNGYFFWDAVGGATQYRIDFGVPRGYDGPVPQCGCFATEYHSIYEITNTSYPIPLELVNECFVWSVSAYCPEIGWSQPSGLECYPEGGLIGRVETLNNEISIFPNPSTNQLFIRFSHTEVMDVEVYDFQGKLILSATELSHSDALDVSELPVGIYILRDPNDQVAPIRFVKK